MGISNLCSNDPVLETLRDFFDATPLRIPEERVQPGILLSRIGLKAHFLGPVTSAVDTLETFETHRSSLSNVSNMKTSAVKIGLGLNILDGFLSGFGLPGCGINAKSKLWSESTLQFSFPNVERKYFDLVSFSKILGGYNFDIQNPIFTPILKGKARLMVIDSILACSEFKVTFSKTANLDFLLNMNESNDQEHHNKLANIQSTPGNGLLIRSHKRLTFAFSCVELILEETGSLLSMRNSTKVRQLNALPEDEFPSLRSQRFYDEDGLLFWDEPL